jgi:hypothetical protein
MSETKRDPLQRLNTPQSPAEIKPLDGPEQQALAIIERAAREMATRRPRIQAPAPDDMSAKIIPVEPVEVRAEKHVDELANEFEQELAKNFDMNVDTSVDKSFVKPFEETATPVENLTVAPLPTETPQVETLRVEPSHVEALRKQTWPVEELKPPFAMDPTDEPADEPAPPEDAKPLDLVEAFKWAEDAKPLDPSEPVAQPASDEPLDFAAPMPPAAAIAPALPEAAPPVVPRAQPRPAPAATVPAMRPMFDDHFHLSLTTVQSAALAVAIFAFVLAAFGMAARGYVSAHDWSCRVGMTTNSCPPAPPPKSLGLAEIPS